MYELLEGLPVSELSYSSGMERHVLEDYFSASGSAVPSEPSSSCPQKFKLVSPPATPPSLRAPVVRGRPRAASEAPRALLGSGKSRGEQ